MTDPRLFNLQVTVTDALNQSASKNLLVTINSQKQAHPVVYPVLSLVTDLNLISLITDGGVPPVPVDSLITTHISPTFPIPSSTSDNLIATHVSASNMKLMPFPGAGNIICTSGAPVAGAGKAFEFTRYGDFIVNVNVKPGVQITNDTLNSSRGSPIIAHQWTQLPNAAPSGGTQQGKVEPRCGSMPQAGGSFYITVTAQNRWLVLAARHPGNSNDMYYDVAYIIPNSNGLTIVGF